MKNLIKLFLALSFQMLVSAQLFAQTYPSDLLIIAFSGDESPWGKSSYLRVENNGTGVYYRTQNNRPGETPLQSTRFTLNSTQLGTIWAAIQNQKYYDLKNRYEDDTIRDRSFARLFVRGNGVGKSVTTKNVAVVAFDNVISVINGITPANCKLEYETSQPPEIIDREICGNTNSRTFISSDKNYSERNQLRKNVKGELKDAQVNPEAHAGTTVGYPMSLEFATLRGLATLTAKGDYLGDQVSIHLENQPPYQADEVQVNLYLEFWGSHATVNEARRIENAIESIWNGNTTRDGKRVNFNVETRIHPGLGYPPGTPGYHQIELVGASNNPSYVNSISTLNHERTGGRWDTIGDDLTNLGQMWAHEAGHLMGLEDKYTGYEKGSDGKWICETDGSSYTTDELIPKIKNEYPEKTEADLKKILNSETANRITAAFQGSEHDLMASTKGVIQQYAIDQIAANAGIIVSVEPGDMLINKEWFSQSMTIIRAQDIFVAAGDSKSLEGLYAACIDAYYAVPSEGGYFDVAPSLNKWTNYESAQKLLQFLNFVNSTEAFCEDDTLTQMAIWRLTANKYIGNSLVENILNQAGVDADDEEYRFPSITNPDVWGTTTRYYLPEELYLLKITASKNIAAKNDPISLSIDFSSPSLDNGILQILDLRTELIYKPENSSVGITRAEAAKIDFITDKVGHYKFKSTINCQLSHEEENYEFDRQAVSRVVARNHHTETFESGTLTDGALPWRTTGANSWEVVARNPNTGQYAALPGMIIENEQSSLKIDFELPTPDKIQFAYRSVTSMYDRFIFMVDGIVTDTLRSTCSINDDFDLVDGWDSYSYQLSAGLHEIEWLYVKDSVDIYNGESNVALDDIILPENAMISGVSRPESNGRVLIYGLSQNFPNPFNPTTTFNFQLPRSSRITIKIYNLLGEEIDTVLDELKASGVYSIPFDGSSLTSGVYYYKMQAGRFSAVKKMILLK